MIHAILVGIMLVSASPADAKAEYQAKLAKVGTDADSQVRLALWCESHGLDAERAKHLATAVLTDPGHVMARSLAGLVEVHGKWKRPEAVAQALEADPVKASTLAEYRQKRENLPRTADAHTRLATWCDTNGLADEASAHWRNVLRLDFNRDVAWRRLGYKKVKGRWVTDQQLVAERIESEAQAKANQKWVPKLKRLADRLKDSDQTKLAPHQAELANITDPRAVPAVWDIFARTPARQDHAVQILGQIPGRDASERLAYLALFGATSDTRRKAIETLRFRDSREFLGSTISLVQTPWKVQFRPVQQPDQVGQLFAEGPEFNLKRTYTFIPANVIGLLNGGPERFEREIRNVQSAVPNLMGLPTNADFHAVSRAVDASLGSASPASSASAKSGQLSGNELVAAISAQQLTNTLARSGGMDRLLRQRDLRDPVLQSNLSASSAQQLLESDLAVIGAENQRIASINQPILNLLETVTGEKLGDDRDAWKSWWSDQQGQFYQYKTLQEKPTITETIVSPYLPPNFSTSSCFAAGTAVRTISGSRPIESLAVGDKVLVQDVQAGALSFEAITGTFPNPPATTLKIELGGEIITATPIHQFWKAGKGWTMARNLKVGDTIRTLEGVVQVSSIEEGVVQPVFNLEVARGSSFLVGAQGVVVHDNTLVEPTVKAFDAVTED